MGFAIDFSEIEQFVKNMEIAEQDFNQFLYNFLLEMAYRIIANTKKKTPVDTGALRNAWAVETDKVTEKTVRRKHKSEKSKRKGFTHVKQYTQEGDVIVSGEGATLAVVLTNPMEYATDIEYGHRIVVGTGENKREVGWFNGVFMLKTSIEYVQKEMPLRFEKEFKEFCKQHGIEV